MICSSDVKTAVTARTIIFVKKKQKNPPVHIMRKQGHGYHYAFFRKSLQRWLFDKHCALFIRNIFPLVNHSFYHRNWARLRRLGTLILFPNDVHFNYNYTTGLICVLPHPLETRVWKENESS